MSGVYILQDPQSGFLKIGRATDLEKRLKNLRTANPRLEVLHWIETEADSALESYLHGRLGPQRREGEFFEVTVEAVMDEVRFGLDCINSRPNDSDLERIKKSTELVNARDPEEPDLQLIQEILRVRSEKKRLEVLEDTLEQQLILKVGISRGITGWLTYDTVSKTTIDSSGLKAKYPDIAQEFMKVSCSRSLKISPYSR